MTKTKDHTRGVSVPGSAAPGSTASVNELIITHLPQLYKDAVGADINGVYYSRKQYESLSGRDDE